MNRPLVVAAWIGILGALAPASPGARAEEGAPGSPAEAVERARPLLDASIQALPVENKDTKPFKENAERLRSALALLKGQSKEGLSIPSFQAAWNETVTLFHYHGVKPAPDYHLVEQRLQLQPIRFALPVGRGWEFEAMVPGKDEQVWGVIRRRLEGDRVVREIKIWVYRWDTVYSGIGGENAKGLAEMALKADRETTTKITFRSDRVVTARMGRGFPKTSYYEIVGEDGERGPVRRRNYYVKGPLATYAFEVIEMRKTDPEDDPWTAWQVKETDPELEAIVESFAEVQEKKK